MWIRGRLEIDFALASGREARLVSSRTRSGAGRRYPVPRHATAPFYPFRYVAYLLRQTLGVCLVVVKQRVEFGTGRRMLGRQPYPPETTVQLPFSASRRHGGLSGMGSRP